MKIGIDIDGVLAGFWPAIVKRFDRPQYLKNWDDPVSKVDEIWEEIENEYEFWANLPVLNTSKQLTFDIDCYITSIPFGMYEARLEWLRRHNFPDVPCFIAPNHNKIQIAVERGLDLFIDDKPSTVKAMNDAGITCLQFKPPYFTDDMPHAFTSLKQIQKYIDKC